MTQQIIEAIAKICHQANKAYCESICGDFSQVDWENAPDWQKKNIIEGVKKQMQNPNITPEQSHIAYCEVLKADGWVWGETKDPQAKTHPCLVPYSELPATERWKDDLRIGIVNSFLPR